MVLAAVAAVAWPLFRKPRVEVARVDDATIERLVSNYREALKADTVCDRCLRDNPPASRFCAECGFALHKA